MSWLMFWRRKPKAAVAPAPAPSSDDMMGGRRFVAGVPYMLPKDLDETNRLDFQHHMLRSFMRGNYLAPIGKPRDILDVGCGTGRWAMELATQFPSANLPFHLPLEGVTYSNVQIDEQEFLMRAEAQVRRALGGQ